MTSTADEIRNLRAALTTIETWAKEAATVCRDPLEKDAWYAVAEIAGDGLKTQRASVIREVPRSLTWRERLTGMTRPSTPVS